MLIQNFGINFFESINHLTRYLLQFINLLYINHTKYHQHSSFLFPAFESGFRFSRNGGSPVIWIISLYLRYQVYFVIIIAEFLVNVLNITYL